MTDESRSPEMAERQPPETVVGEVPPIDRPVSQTAPADQNEPSNPSASDPSPPAGTTVNPRKSGEPQKASVQGPIDPVTPVAAAKPVRKQETDPSTLAQIFVAITTLALALATGWLAHETHKSVQSLTEQIDQTKEHILTVREEVRATLQIAVSIGQLSNVISRQQQVLERAVELQEIQGGRFADAVLAVRRNLPAPIPGVLTIECSQRVTHQPGQLTFTLEHPLRCPRIDVFLSNLNDAPIAADGNVTFEDFGSVICPLEGAPSLPAGTARRRYRVDLEKCLFQRQKQLPDILRGQINFRVRENS